jgi:hypothetical protein
LRAIAVYLPGRLNPTWVVQSASKNNDYPWHDVAFVRQAGAAFWAETMMFGFSAIPYKIIDLGGAIDCQCIGRQRNHHAKGAPGGLLTCYAMANEGEERVSVGTIGNLAAEAASSDLKHSTLLLTDP